VIVIILAAVGAVLLSVGAGVKWGLGDGLMCAGLCCLAGAALAEYVMQKMRKGAL
jgi:hypothetical protein